MKEKTLQDMKKKTLRKSAVLTARRPKKSSADKPVFNSGYVLTVAGDSISDYAENHVLCTRSNNSISMRVESKALLCVESLQSIG